MKVSPLPGKPAPRSMLVDARALVSAYSSEVPDPAIPGQRVAFGASGHRGSSFQRTFNEWHVLAITQAICRYRVGGEESAGTSLGGLTVGSDGGRRDAPARGTAR